MNRATLYRLLAATAAGASLVPFGAFAQEAQSTTEISEVVVTASRVQRSGFSAPTPVTVIGAEQIEARAAVNVADVINEIPSFRPSQTPQARAINGAFGANFVDLRGLGTVRTLVLIDGHRHVPATTLGEVDLNNVPSSLVERTEVVTGGASAAWGSDAVAGVVNLVLKDKLQGVVGNVSYGQTDKKDDKSFNASIGAGGDFAGGRGHVIVGAEYDKMGGVGDYLTARNWSAQQFGTLTLPANRPAGLASRIVSPNVHYSNQLAAAGIIPSGPLANTTFLPNGTPVPFAPGTLVAGNQQIGGDNQSLSFNSNLNIVNPVRRNAELLRVSFDITSSFNVYAQIEGGNSDQHSLSAGRINQANLTIKNDNAFLPPALKAQMLALGLASVPFGRFDSEIGRYAQHNYRDTQTALAGFKGGFGNGWSYDGYIQEGVNTSVSDVPNMTITPNYLAAIDAVAGPNGSIVCRTGTPTFAAADPGCVPYNVFGVGAPSLAAQQYVSGLAHTRTFNREQVSAVNLRGEPVSIWAGPISLAVGAEWRKESTDVTSDNNQQLSRDDFGNTHAIAGQQTVKEAYVETVVPLIKDLSIVKSLDLNAAGRRTDYSLAGGVTTWKVGATVEDSSGQLRLRGTKSRDIRAPNLQELYGAAATSVLNIRDPSTGFSSLTTVLTSGSTSLTPEKADTLTYGAVLSPHFVPNFRISADYYRIDISGVIGVLGAQNVVDRCAAGVTSLCPLVIRSGPTNGITTVLNTNQNINRLKTSGVDIEADYNIPLDRMNVPGNLTFRVLGTRVFEIATTDTVSTIDRVRQQVPLWSWTANANYSLGRLGTNITERYIGPTLIDTTLIGPDNPAYSPALPNSINLNAIPAVYYTDVSAQWTLSEHDNAKLVVYGVVNNLFDQTPPDGAPGNLIGASLFDLVGRFVRVGVRFNY